MTNHKVAYTSIWGRQVTAEYKQEMGLSFMDIRDAETGNRLASPFMEPHEAETFFNNIELEK